MKNFIPKLEAFKKEFAKLKYLTNITPSTPWDFYKHIISNVNLEEIFKLSNEEIELFSRLKFAAIQKKIDNLGVEE